MNPGGCQTWYFYRGSIEFKELLCGCLKTLLVDRACHDLEISMIPTWEMWGSYHRLAYIDVV